MVENDVILRGLVLFKDAFPGRINQIIKSKEEGRKIMGTLCLYVPDELIYASGADRVILCGGRNVLEYYIKENEIKSANETRKLLHAIYELRRRNSPPIRGTEMLRVIQQMHFLSPDEFRKNLVLLLDELKVKKREDSGPRIMVSGCPMAAGNMKVPEIIENRGGMIVVEESCTGTRAFWDLVDENKEPIRAIAERYMKIPCACRYPNDRRINQIIEFARDFNIDGVVYYTLQFCGRSSIGFANKTISEITAHAKGVGYLIPEAHTIIDIGGQDSKAIITENDKVVDFLMNDRCAAGTGKFLEYTAKAFEISLDELGTLSKISKKEDIAAGLIESITQLTTAMVKKLGIKPEVAFVGGVAKNPGIVKAFEKALDIKIKLPEEPQITGALGAALLA